MNIKKEYLILLLVIICLTLYLILGRSDHPDTNLPDLKALDNTKINRMVITGMETQLELAKKDERWFIQPNQYRVDTITIKNMVNAAAELTLTAVVSESGNYQRYQLDNDTRLKVQVYSDAQIEREFNIGRAAPTFAHTFVQIPNDKKVYHAQGRLNDTFKQTIDGLRDKTVLSFAQERITGLQIQKGERSLALAKSEIVEEVEKDDGAEPSAPTTKAQWQSSTGNIASTSAVSALLNVLSNLKCDSYLADDAKASLPDATWTVTLKSDSDEWTLSAFAEREKDATQIPALSSANEYAFWLSKNRVGNMEKQIETLLKP